MSEFSYSEELKIDIYNLHREAQNQPALLMRYATEYARAKRRMSHKEREVKVKRAQIGREIRESGEKLTVDAIKEKIELHPEVVLMELEIVELAFNVNIMWSAVEAFKDRRSEIGEIIELYKLGYFSQSVTTPTKEFMTEQISQDQAEDLRKVGEEIKKQKLTK